MDILKKTDRQKDRKITVWNKGIQRKEKIYSRKKDRYNRQKDRYNRQKDRQIDIYKDRYLKDRKIYRRIEI